MCVWLWVKTNRTVPFWGRCTTHFRTYFSGDWDVHWGYDLAFDPWPCLLSPVDRPCLPCLGGALPGQGEPLRLERGRKGVARNSVLTQAHLGCGSTPMVPFCCRCTTHFSGDWDVHWQYGLLTHGHFRTSRLARKSRGTFFVKPLEWSSQKV